MEPSVREHFETTVVRRLAALGRRLRWYILLDGLAVVSAAVLVFVLITLGVDYFGRLDRDLRVAQLLSILAMLATLAWWHLLRPLSVPIRLEPLALLVERKFPQLSSLLVSAIDFARPGHSGGSPAMMDSVIRDASRRVADLPFESVLAHRRARRRSMATLSCLGVLVVMSFVAGPTMSMWLRRNVLLQNVAWPQRNHLTMENLTDNRIIAPRNEDVTISAVVDRGYQPPRQAFVEFETAAGVHGREQMPATSQQEVRFTHTFERLTESLRCRVVGGDAATDWFDIQVVDRPQIKDAIVEVTPPAYTRMDRYELRAGQTAADVLIGSRVRLRIEANKLLSRAVLIRQDANREVVLGPASSQDSLHYVSDITPTTNSTYQFILLDTIGLSNRSERLVPMRFNIRLIADKPPVVKMRIKDVGDMITRQAILPVEGTFADQYGLATAGVGFEIARDRTPPRSAFEPMPGFEPATRNFAHQMEWSSEQHKLTEGDRINLFCQATDFDDISGPNLGKSAAVSLRVVPSEELLAELSRREQEHRRDFERLLREQEELFSDLLATSRPADATQAREYYPRLARRQRDYAGRLNLLRLQFEQVLSKFRINQLATPAVEGRLGQSVIAPMDQLYRTTMPQAAVALEQLPPDAAGPALMQARATQDVVLAQMNRILASLLKWEGYQEAVTLLRDVLKMQKSLEKETEGRIEAQVLGTTPASEPAK
jgi:hypothetical protein